MLLSFAYFSKVFVSHYAIPLIDNHGMMVKALRLIGAFFTGGWDAGAASHDCWRLVKEYNPRR